MNRRRFIATLGLFSTQKWRRFALETDDIGVTTVRFPYVQNVRGDKATIIWGTLERGAGSVQYSSDGVNFNTATARSRDFPQRETGLAAAYTQYECEIADLSPGTQYSYQPFVSNSLVSAGGDLRFRTPGSGTFNFLVLGDSGEASDAQFLIARQMSAERTAPAFIIHTGDLVYPRGTYDQYNRNYFNYYYASMSSVPIFPTPGNHDYDVPGALPYLAIHSVPTESVPAADRGKYYSFDWGNVHFVSLDAHQSLERAVNSGGSMLRWLDNDLRSTRLFWRVVFFHYPPYATGPNAGDIRSAWARQYIVPILERHGVHVVLSGHEHSYQRSESLWKSGVVRANTGITYFTSGGGGAFLYYVAPSPVIAFNSSIHHFLRVEVSRTRMIFHAINKDGVEVESSTLAPQPMFADDAGRRVVFDPAPTAGAQVRISGRSLAAEETLVCTSPPPTQVAGTTVTINGRPISLLYVSHNQIYGQLPFTVLGNITVRVSTPNGVAETSVNP